MALKLTKFNQEILNHSNLLRTLYTEIFFLIAPKNSTMYGVILTIAASKFQEFFSNSKRVRSCVQQIKCEVPVISTSKFLATSLVANLRTSLSVDKMAFLLNSAQQFIDPFFEPYFFQKCFRGEKIQVAYTGTNGGPKEKDEARRAQRRAVKKKKGVLPSVLWFTCSEGISRIFNYGVKTYIGALKVPREGLKKVTLTIILKIFCIRF